MAEDTNTYVYNPDAERQSVELTRPASAKDRTIGVVVKAYGKDLAETAARATEQFKAACAANPKPGGE